MFQRYVQFTLEIRIEPRHLPCLPVVAHDHLVGQVLMKRAAKEREREDTE
jgi:hypothetical protein